MPEHRSKAAVFPLRWIIAVPAHVQFEPTTETAPPVPQMLTFLVSCVLPNTFSESIDKFAIAGFSYTATILHLTPPPHLRYILCSAVRSLVEMAGEISGSTLVPRSKVMGSSGVFESASSLQTPVTSKHICFSQALGIRGPRTS